MSGQDAFGPNLRRLRIQRGVTLDQIAAQTNVSAVLWAAMERNDFSRWPNGVFARAFIRDYARIVAADPDATVDEFCRWFPTGDRRAEGQIRVQAEIINHDLQWSDDLPPTVAEGDRRWSPESAAPMAKLEAVLPAPRQAGMFDRLRRVLNRA
jgi:transcriptional regulator with XRE-family HTH domain